MSVVLPFILLFLLLLLGMPVFFALGIAGSVGVLLNNGLNAFMGFLQTTPYGSVSSFMLSTIPMFILMAHFMLASGIIKDLFTSANKWFGHYPGGLGIATVFAGAGMGAVSGSSTASASAMATAAVPEMKKFGYSLPFSMGVVSISGTLAIMIPPSIALIIYGILTETGIDLLLIAGIIPGIVTALGYIVTILIWTKLKSDVAKKVEAVPIKERMLSLRHLWVILLLIITVLGSIYTGVVTPTEAGAMGAFGAFLIALGMKRMSLKVLSQALKDTLKSTTMIFAIVIGATIFGQFLTLTQVTQKLVAFLGGLDVSRWVILSIIILIYLLLGMFMDQTAILLLTVPMTFPIVSSLGFDPIWYGILIVKTAEIGLVTPPVGMNVFVASGSVGVNPSVAFKGVFWFVVTDLIILILLILLPVLSTWLPTSMN
jgi:C4-dicarboxylate transporter, DctM subunit